MTRDLTSQAGNPASRIQATYQDLMAVADIDTLKVKALDLIGQGGVSAKNAAKFKQVVVGEQRIDRLRSYLTNYMLAGAGLSVGAGSRGSRG